MATTLPVAALPRVPVADEGAVRRSCGSDLDGLDPEVAAAVRALDAAGTTGLADTLIGLADGSDFRRLAQAVPRLRYAAPALLLAGETTAAEHAAFSLLDVDIDASRAAVAADVAFVSREVLRAAREKPELLPDTEAALHRLQALAEGVPETGGIPVDVPFLLAAIPRLRLRILKGAGRDAPLRRCLSALMSAQSSAGRAANANGARNEEGLLPWVLPALRANGVSPLARGAPPAVSAAEVPTLDDLAAFIPDRDTPVPPAVWDKLRVKLCWALLEESGALGEVRAQVRPASLSAALAAAGATDSAPRDTDETASGGAGGAVTDSEAKEFGCGPFILSHAALRPECVEHAIRVWRGSPPTFAEAKRAARSLCVPAEGEARAAPVAPEPASVEDLAEARRRHIQEGHRYDMPGLISDEAFLSGCMDEAERRTETEVWKPRGPAFVWRTRISTPHPAVGSRVRVRAASATKGVRDTGRPAWFADVDSDKLVVTHEVWATYVLRSTEWEAGSASAWARVVNVEGRGLCTLHLESLSPALPEGDTSQLVAPMRVAGHSLFTSVMCGRRELDVVVTEADAVVAVLELKTRTADKALAQMHAALDESLAPRTRKVEESPEHFVGRLRTAIAEGAPLHSFAASAPAFGGIDSICPLLGDAEVAAFRAVADGMRAPRKAKRPRVEVCETREFRFTADGWTPAANKMPEGLSARDASRLALLSAAPSPDTLGSLRYALFPAVNWVQQHEALGLEPPLPLMEAVGEIVAASEVPASAPAVAEACGSRMLVAEGTPEEPTVASLAAVFAREAE